jgi:hypothetical protein
MEAEEDIEADLVADGQERAPEASAGVHEERGLATAFRQPPLRLFEQRRLQLRQAVRCVASTGLQQATDLLWVAQPVHEIAVTDAF